ncbi:MAG TPA: hypothetical protein VFH77_01820 [Streptomyces sp.]|nr:hypothetical protein [Streptomyces sp.]
MSEGQRRQEPGGRIGRRGLLARLGATGLAAAVGVFADGGTARASTGAIPGAASGAMCCDLHNFPANSSYEYCHQNAGYIWYCSLSEYLHCSCCETEGQEFSAAECTTNQDLV